MRPMKLKELIEQLHEAEKMATEEHEWTAEALTATNMYSVTSNGMTVSSINPHGNAEGKAQSIATRHNTAGEVLAYLRAMECLDVGGAMTSATAKDSYGMLNARNVLWDMGWNENRSDPGVDETMVELAGHLQMAFEAGLEVGQSGKSNAK